MCFGYDFIYQARHFVKTELKPFGTHPRVLKVAWGVSEYGFEFFDCRRMVTEVVFGTVSILLYLEFDFLQPASEYSIVVPDKIEVYGLQAVECGE